MRAYYIRRRGEPLILSSLLYAEADGLCDDESMVWISSGLIRREEEEEALGEALAYKGVSQFPARIKCATLAWKACEKALEDGDTDE